MHVLLVCERLSGAGGWYTYARTLAESLRERGHAVTVASAVAEDGSIEALPRPLPLMTSPWRSFKAALKLRKIIRTVSPDVIHIVVEPYMMLIPFLPKKYKSKTVVTLHGSYGVRLLESGLSRFLARRAFRSVAHFVPVSNYTKRTIADILHRYEPSLKPKMTVVKNSIKLPHLHQSPKKSSLRRVLLVGGVKPRKGVREAIEGLAAYKKEHGEHFHFTVAGDLDTHNDYVQSVQKRIAELGMEKLVDFPGRVDDDRLNELYAQSDVFLMPSLTGENTFEGFGIVFLEANARGVPCIGPNTSGAAEAIEDGVNGFTVDPRDPKDIAKKLHMILGEHRITPESCIAWAKKHSAEKGAEEMERVYKQII